MRKPSQLAKWKLKKLMRRHHGLEWADVKNWERPKLEEMCIGWHIVERVDAAPFNMPNDTAHLCPCAANAHRAQGY